MFWFKKKKKIVEDQVKYQNNNPIYIERTFKESREEKTTSINKCLKLWSIFILKQR